MIITAFLLQPILIIEFMLNIHRTIWYSMDVLLIITRKKADNSFEVYMEDILPKKRGYNRALLLDSWCRDKESLVSKTFINLIITHGKQDVVTKLKSPEFPTFWEDYKKLIQNRQDTFYNTLLQILKLQI